MEEDIKELKQEVKNFIEKYNCTLEVNICALGRNLNGKIINPEVEIIIRS